MTQDNQPTTADEKIAQLLRELREIDNLVCEAKGRLAATRHVKEAEARHAAERAADYFRQATTQPDTREGAAARQVYLSFADQAQKHHVAWLRELEEAANDTDMAALAAAVREFHQKKKNGGT